MTYRLAQASETSGSASRSVSRPKPTVLITRRPEGDYPARVSLDEHAGWRSCVADDPFDALDGAAQLAREELAVRLGDPFAADTRG